MLQRSCRVIDERRDFFVATKFFRHFFVAGDYLESAYSPHLSPHSRFFQCQLQFLISDSYIFFFQFLGGKALSFHTLISRGLQ